MFSKRFYDDLKRKISACISHECTSSLCKIHKDISTYLVSNGRIEGLQESLKILEDLKKEYESPEKDPELLANYNPYKK